MFLASSSVGAEPNHWQFFPPLHNQIPYFFLLFFNMYLSPEPFSVHCSTKVQAWPKAWAVPAPSIKKPTIVTATIDILTLIINITPFGLLFEHIHYTSDDFLRPNRMVTFVTLYYVTPIQAVNYVSIHPDRTLATVGARLSAFEWQIGINPLNRCYGQSGSVWNSQTHHSPRIFVDLWICRGTIETE